MKCSLGISNFLEEKCLATRIISKVLYSDVNVLRKKTERKRLEISSRKLEIPKENFKKIRNTKGKFHAKMDTIKDRNGMDLTEAEDIKKRWQEYTEEL